MERPAYIYELLTTRSNGTHTYAVFVRDVGQIGIADSQLDGRRKVWGISPFYGDQRDITRTFSKRETAADVLYAFWREWRTKLDQAQRPQENRSRVG